MKDKKLKKNDEYIVYRVMVSFFSAAVILLLMSRLFNVIDTPVTMDSGRLVCLVVAVASGVCALWGVVSYFVSVKRETHRTGRVFNGMFLAMSALVVLVCALLLYFNHLMGMKIIYVFVPVCAFLFLIYNVYPRHSFVISMTHAYLAFALYSLSRLTESGYRLFVFVSALGVCAISVALYFSTKGNKGRIKLFGATFEFYGRTVKQGYVVALYAISAAVLTACFLLPGIFSFYAMIGTIAFIICSIIYDTVKLM